MNRIVKVGLACLRNGKILLVRKRGSVFFILPGGKMEEGESELMALSRELDEELGCKLDSTTVGHIGAFSDIAAGTQKIEVTVILYTGEIIGTPTPQAEIETLAWVSLENHLTPNLAPSLRNSIMPFLLNQHIKQFA